MELTRFRRLLHSQDSQASKDALKLLDAIDKVYELAETHEMSLLEGYTVDSDDIKQFTKEGVGILISALIKAVGIKRGLDICLETVPYEGVTAALAEWKQETDQARANLE